MKLLMVGGGAIGGITAAYIAMNGYDITIYDVDEEHVRKINENGLFIDGVRGEKRVKIKAVTKLEDKYDIAFLAVKSQYTKDAMEALLPHLKENGIVVSLQNGINEEIIAEMVGIEKTIGAVTGWSATNVAPGHLRQTSEGNFIIGRLDGKITPELEEVKKILESMTEVIITDNIMGHLWTKLLINSTIASLGVIFGVELKELVNDEKLLPIMVALADEVVRVARSLDIKLEKFEGMLDVNLFRIDDFDDFKRVVAIMKIAGEKYKKLKSSMWQDIEKGRKTEIDYINGYVERKAEELGIDTPINNLVIKMVKEIEEGKRKPSYENVEDFYKKIRIPKKWREFDYSNLEYAIYNLPINYKHENVVKMASLQLIGLTYAYAQAFGKITDSIFGKIFIRKDKWEIANLVTAKFLENSGKKFAEIANENYKKKLEPIETAYLYFNNLGKAEIEGNKIILKRCPYYESAKFLGIEKNIDFPVCRHFLNGFADAECNGICKGNEECVIEISKK
ncbi:MAG: 2-dehydropantoate 2-reductase [Thermoplasmata archaeon]|nr:2-dehydropantoate 2-reductase [Thermoplasmata archaeon]